MYVYIDLQFCPRGGLQPLKQVDINGLLSTMARLAYQLQFKDSKLDLIVFLVGACLHLVCFFLVGSC